MSAIEIQTNFAKATLVDGEWQTPGLRDAGNFAKQLNRDYNAGYLPPYVNALNAVEALGGEVLTPEPDPDAMENEETDLPPIY